MKNIFRNSCLLLAAACMAQCTDDMDSIIEQNPELQADKVELSASLTPMKGAQDNENSRLTTTETGKNYWTEDDQLLVYVREDFESNPDGPTPEPKPWEESVYRFNKSKGANYNFYLDGSYKLDNGSLRNKLELDETKKYTWYVVYPFMKAEDMVSPSEAMINIPTVQVQDCNDLMAHVSKHSIIATKKDSHEENTAHPILEMKHAMTLMKFTVVNDEEKAVTLQSLIFQCSDRGLSSENGTEKDFHINFYRPEVVCYGDGRDYATVKLKNAKKLQPGETCDVYMVLPPFYVSEGNMSIMISSDAGIFRETKNFDHLGADNPLRFEAGSLNTATVHLKGSVPDGICTGFDPDFLNYLVDPNRGNLDLNGDGQLSLSEAKMVSTLYIRDKNLTSIKGIENFTELLDLEVCEWDDETEEPLPGRLTQVDLSKNLKLLSVDFSKQPLTELNLENNKELIYVGVGGTKLTSLNLQNQTKLEELEMSYSNMTSLPKLNAPKLEGVYCTKCNMTELDLSQYSQLYEVDCDSNQITKLILPANVPYVNCSVNKIKEFDLTGVKQFYTFNATGNPGIKLTMTEAQAHNTNIHYDSDAQIIVKKTPILPFVDEEFKKALTVNPEYDKDRDGEISEYEAGELNVIDISDGSKVTSLMDISNFPNANSFECRKMSKITDVDLSKNMNIVHFFAEGCVALKTFKAGPREADQPMSLILDAASDPRQLNTVMTEVDLSDTGLRDLILHGFQNLKTVYVRQGTSEEVYREIPKDIVKFK